MNYFATNIRILRDKKGLSQAEMKAQLGIPRTTWASYENGASQPSIDGILGIAAFFGVEPGDLLTKNLSHVHLNEKTETAENVHPNVHGNVHPMGKNKPYGQVEQPELVASEPAPKIVHELPKVITIDSHGNENAVFVPAKARAGYLVGYGDPEFIETLPAYSLPGHHNGTFRIFEVNGLSMFNTLQDKDKVIGRWINVSEIRDDRVHVLVTRNDGVLIKRVLNRVSEGKLICKSDNNHHGEYPNIVLDTNEVIEVWYVVERWTRMLPSPGEIYKRIIDLEADITLIKQKLLKG